MSHNRLRFLLECLADLNSQLASRGGRLHVLQGDPAQILARIQLDVGLDLLSFDEVGGKVFRSCCGVARGATA